MKFKTGFVVGAAVGYYLGAKAGRERYVQIERALDRVRANGVYRGAVDQVSARIGDVRGRARDHAATMTNEALDAMLGTEAEATWEPGLEFNPDYRPTAEEIEADFFGRGPSA